MMKKIIRICLPILACLILTQCQPVDRSNSRFVRNDVNKSLAAVSDILNPSDGSTPNYESAIQKAKAIDTTDWRPYEKSQLHSMLGSAYILSENYPLAVEEYNKYLTTPALTEIERNNIRYTLGSLYLILEDNKKAIDNLELAIKTAGANKSDYLFRLGQAYFNDGQMDAALANVRASVMLDSESGRQPNDSRRKYLYYLCLHDKKYETTEEATQIIEKCYLGAEVSAVLNEMMAENRHQTPIVRLEPAYPAEAAENKIEGYVVVSFSINREGNVENPVVIESEPQNIFDESALKAVSGWRYYPKFEDGKRVTVNDVQVRLDFNLKK